MSKITIQIGFYLQDEHYAQMQAFLPRSQAIKIPQLRIEQRATLPKAQQQKPSKASKNNKQSEQQQSEKSDSKKAESEEEINEEEEENLNEMEQEDEGEGEELMDDEQVEEEKIDSEKEEENLLRYLEEDDDSEDDLGDDDDQDLSSISRSMSVARNNVKTKRQKGDRQGLMQLPDRRPRKDKKVDQATQVIRRQEKQRKRKQYLKKQVQAQQKATLDKILNETGRKLKLREQKENEDQRRKQGKQFSNLGDTAKITTLATRQGTMILLHKAELFGEEMTRVPQVRVRAQCSRCGGGEGRYTIRGSGKVACSLVCYKQLVV